MTPRSRLGCVLVVHDLLHDTALFFNCRRIIEILEERSITFTLKSGSSGNSRAWRFGPRRNPRNPIHRSRGRHNFVLQSLQLPKTSLMILLFTLELPHQFLLLFDKVIILKWSTRSRSNRFWYQSCCLSDNRWRLISTSTALSFMRSRWSHR